MQAVNLLVDEVYQSLGMTGAGETTEGTYSEIGCRELNRLISTLNSQGYLALSQDSVDVPQAHEYYFRKLAPGETAGGNVIDMAPPEKIEGVSRRIGNRWLPLHPMNKQQMAMMNPRQMATAWTYDRKIEEGPDGPREVGIVSLDGRAYQGTRIWYNSKLPTYTLDDRIYLSDLYNELLFTGLKLRLAQYHDLAESKKAEAETDFKVAKSLIKRATINQRMLVNGGVTGDWRDQYQNGLVGNGF